MSSPAPKSISPTIVTAPCASMVSSPSPVAMSPRSTLSATVRVSATGRLSASSSNDTRPLTTESVTLTVAGAPSRRNACGASISALFSIVTAMLPDWPLAAWMPTPSSLSSVVELCVAYTLPPSTTTVAVPSP